MTQTTNLSPALARGRSANADRLDFGRLLPLFFIVFVDVLGLTVILPLLHLYAVAFGADAFTIGLLAATYPLMQFIGAPLLGRLSDRIGRKPVLLVSQVGTMIGFVVLALANSLALVFLARVIDGLSGANIAVAQAAITDMTSRRNRAQGLGLTGAAFGLAFIFGPVIAFVMLSFTNSYALPALVAALYSLLSIWMTRTLFHETLPASAREAASASRRTAGLGQIARSLFNPQINVLLGLLFAQQVVFFGFESLLGLFTLNRLGVTGLGNALIFSFVGVILVWVQVRNIGPWSRRYGERRVIFAALAALGLGLALTAFTPEQPFLGYSQARTLAGLDTSDRSGLSRSESLSPRDIAVSLPPDDHNGVGGMLWILAAMIPVSIGAGLLRPSINSLVTKRVPAAEVGSALGVNAALVSAANATAPILAGAVFEGYGATALFLLGGAGLGVLLLGALLLLRPGAEEAA